MAQPTLDHTPITLSCFGAITMSILVHIMVVSVILALPTPPQPTKTPVLQASLVSQDTFANIHTQIAQAAKTYQAQNTPSQPKKSATHAYNDALAKREQAYQAQMQAYAQALDEQIAAEIQLHHNQQEAAQKQQEQEVAELKERAMNNEDITRHNKQHLDRHNKNLVDTSTHQEDNPSTNKPLTSNHSSPVTGGSSSNYDQNAVASRIQAIWQEYDNPSNQRLTATIYIDDNGNLTNIKFGSGDKELEPSLKDSIKKAAPFPEMAGSNSFTIHFSTK